MGYELVLKELSLESLNLTLPVEPWEYMRAWTHSLELFSCASDLGMSLKIRIGVELFQSTSAIQIEFLGEDTLQKISKTQLYSEGLASDTG